MSNPFKSSLFGKLAGYETLNKRMTKASDEFKKGKFTPLIKSDIAKAMNVTNNKVDFMIFLKQKSIDVVFRENELGRIYGVTFIDHKQKAVYNGSRLGKDFSANVFNGLFGQNITSQKSALNNVFDLNHADDSFASSVSDKESVIEQAFGLLNFEQHGNDYEEENFARRMKRKKKKKRGFGLG